MLEDKKTIFTIKNGLTAYDRTYQHTGDSAGYVGDQNGFYTLYNSGFDKDGNHYRSELYRQFNGKWKKDVIPYYIRASGFDGDSIYALIPTDDEKGYKILKIRTDQKDLTYETIAEWSYKEGTSVESQLAADQESVHFVVRGEKADNIYQMVKVDKKAAKLNFMTSPHTKKTNKFYTTPCRSASKKLFLLSKASLFHRRLRQSLSNQLPNR